MAYSLLFLFHCVEYIFPKVPSPICFINLNSSILKLPSIISNESIELFLSFSISKLSSSLLSFLSKEFFFKLFSKSLLLFEFDLLAKLLTLIFKLIFLLERINLVLI